VAAAWFLWGRRTAKKKKTEKHLLSASKIARVQNSPICEQKIYTSGKRELLVVTILAINTEKQRKPNRKHGFGRESNNTGGDQKNGVLQGNTKTKQAGTLFWVKKKNCEDRRKEK